jgi:hypothetical protein
MAVASFIWKIRARLGFGRAGFDVGLVVGSRQGSVCRQELREGL